MRGSVSQFSTRCVVSHPRNMYKLNPRFCVVVLHKGNRVDCLPKDIQKDMLAQTPERANSPLKMGKGSRRLRSPKREKTEADKRKSVNSLREVLKNWQPGASLDAHEYESSQRVPLPASQILPHAQQEQVNLGMSCQ